MRLSDRELTSLRIKGSILQKVETTRFSSPKIKFSQAFWYMYPVLLYYAWEGVVW